MRTNFSLQEILNQRTKAAVRDYLEEQLLNQFGQDLDRLIDDIQKDIDVEMIQIADELDLKITYKRRH